ncbi:isoamyl acetate-hydrolyzing esterase [Coemansia sp. RSA 2322]|nr:isoamyl acetate-hydrolyzing esterase [Coemansia sp. RSA 2322]
MRLLPSRWLARNLALLCVATLVALNLFHLYSRFNAQPPPFSTATYDIALAFGDSHTQHAFDPETSGWLAHLARLYERRMDMLNRGFANYTTSDARNVAHLILPKLSLKHVLNRTDAWNRPQRWPDSRDRTLPDSAPFLRLLIVCFGSYDAALEGSPWRVPLPQFTENLRYLLSLVRSPDSDFYSPYTRILLITPPPLGDRMHKDAMQRKGLPPVYANNSTRLYAQAVLDLSRELELPCVDLWSAIEAMVKKAADRAPLAVAARNTPRNNPGNTPGNNPESLDFYKHNLLPASPYDGYEMYLSDGFSLNANGNKLLYNLIATKLLNTWPDFKPY